MTDALTPQPTADLADAHGDRIRVLRLPMRDFGGVVRFAGRARTIVTLEDTRLLVEALYGTPGNGAVAVVDGGGSTRSALLGDQNAEKLHSNGWAGVIINGVVRDVSLLREVGIGIKALGASPQRSGKNGIGAVDVPVAFGETLFAPGDCIYCDEDGVVVSKTPLGP